jgi:cyclic beta-1,2-glucan glucanotransferase
MALIAAGLGTEVTDRPGGVSVKLADHISPEDRILLQAVARFIITDSGGSLAEQLKAEPADYDRPRPRPLQREKTSCEIPSRNLIFFNGLGAS